MRTSPIERFRMAKEVLALVKKDGASGLPRPETSRIAKKQLREASKEMDNNFGKRD